MKNTSVSDADLIFSGPRALAAKIAAREISARELVEASLRRIAAVNESLNAFRVVMEEEALAAADVIDARSEPAGALAGVPLAVKDDAPLTGQRMTLGSRAGAPVQDADAEFIRRLRAAGAIPIGVTNVPELMLFPWTASAANGITRNPWKLDRTTGGSSGGSAAAVASGMVPMATASDGGGSIRIPAACCGLVGMKPTRGRVPTQPYGPIWLGLSTYGALARTVVDSAFLLDIIHGTFPADGDPTASPLGSFVRAALTKPERPLRIAISRKLPAGTTAQLSPDQRRAWDQTAHLLTDLGHHVEERDPEYGTLSLEFIQNFMRAAHEQAAKISEPHLLEKSTRQLAALGGRLVPAGRRDKLLANREKTITRITRLWDDFDVLLTPGLATTAIAAEGGFGKGALTALNTSARFMPWFPAWNLTGQPAISLPAGFDGDGLPLSIQLIGRHEDEETLYSLAGQIEAVRPWASNRPLTK